MMSSQIRLGVVGYGERARHVAQLICSQDPTSVRLTAVADPNFETIRQKLDAEGKTPEGVTFYAEADEMLDGESLDGVIIGTRCGMHATMAIKVMARGIAVFLEKPVATNMRDLLALREMGRGSRSGAVNPGSRVVVSFPLRTSSLVQLAKQIIDSGRIGTVEHVQAWCDVPYGAVYYQSWYRDEAETQGMFLQKASHDFDYINHLVTGGGGNRPRVISAMNSKRVFTGSHPAGLHCMDCAERTTCFESPYHPSKAESLSLDKPSKEMCAFAVDTGNEDSGSALIQYESGMHVVYSQNFYSRNKAATRGARLIGYHGTIEFDWFTDTLRVYHHHSNHVETHQFDVSSSFHGGGDDVLARNFLQVMRGEAPAITSLEEGLVNGLMCLKAKESAATHRFMPLEFPPVSVASETPVRLGGRQNMMAVNGVG